MPSSARLAASSFLQNSLISWDRCLDASGGTRGLWAMGFIANRSEIVAQIGSAEERSDLDLAAALYERFGDETPCRIHGPFAWIAWDGNHQRLIAVRDRLGIHEIYYRDHLSSILLAGSIEPLLEISQSCAVNPHAILAHLQGCAPAAPETFYQGISAVAAGSMLIVTHDRIETEMYWRPEPRPLLRLRDDESYALAFRDLLLPIVTEYTPPGNVGVMLSGGLDSTTVAASVREVSPQSRLTAFTWSASELPEANESEAVSAVCQQLGCLAVTIAADQHWPLRGNDGIRPELATPHFNVYTDVWDATFRAVREQGIGVLFSGTSGDSLFGGDVFSYPDLLLSGQWRKLVSEVRMQRKHSDLSAAAIVRWMVLAPIANAYIPGWERDRKPPMPWLGERLRQEMPLAPMEVPRWLLPGRRERLRLLRDPLLPLVTSLATRHAAGHGVDFRHPLLDHRLFDFAASIPTAQTFAAGKRKVILRNAMRGHLPEAVLNQRGKTYPDAIAGRGLREREPEKVWALMTNMRAAQMGFVDECRLRAAYGDYLAGRDWRGYFWRALTLEVWLRRYLP